MQALPTQGLRINKAHPDARGCFFAVPVMERGGEAVRNVAGTAGFGQPAWTGTRSYGHLHGGRCIISSAGGNYVVTPTTAQPITKALTIMARVNATALTNGGTIARACGGYLGLNNVNTFSLWIDSGALRADSVQTVLINTEYAMGVRWRDSDQTATFYLNGQMDVGATALVYTPSATTASIGGGGFTTVAASIRDVRIWNRELPDKAFERYYTNPNAFYTIGKAVSAPKRVGGAGSMFFPFLHPSLQGA